MTVKERFAALKDGSINATAIVKTDTDELNEWLLSKQKGAAEIEALDLTPNGSSEEDYGSSDNEDVKSFEQYFHDQASKAATASSDRTMADLPHLTVKEYHRLLGNVDDQNRTEKQAIRERLGSQFNQWFLELKEGFSLMFYGYGSKRELLNTFVHSCLDDGPVVAINGYFPSLTGKDIVYKVWQVVECFSQLDEDSSVATIEDQLAAIRRHLNSDKAQLNLYLVIHNIDGSSLRQERTHQALAKLASCKNLHLVASIDHIGAPLLWDTSQIGQFNFVWHDATTFEMYDKELSYEASKLIESDEVGGTRGIEFVLASLTSNSKKIFGVLAQHQLNLLQSTGDKQLLSFDPDASSSDDEENENGKKRKSCKKGSGSSLKFASFGLSYPAYYSLCKQKFLVNNDMTFRTQLTEFRDHQIIHHNRSNDGTEILYIPLQVRELSKLLEQCS